MNILYSKNKQKFISYHKLNALKKKAPSIIFHHGLMSNMNGAKALYIEDYCKEKGYNFIKFDNFGHGNSSGKFIDQTITSWLEGLSLVIDNLCDGPFILVGSSMGGWITMLKSMEKPQKIIGMIAISAAPDFTEELMWNKITKEQQADLIKNGLTNITGSDSNCNNTYPVSYQLIIDGRKYLLLNKKSIDISCPVHLIHGMKDIDVPYSISERAAATIIANEIILKLIKGANHSLSRQEDLIVICNSIEEILSLY